MLRCDLPAIRKAALLALVVLVVGGCGGHKSTAPATTPSVTQSGTTTTSTHGTTTTLPRTSTSRHTTTTTTPTTTPPATTPTHPATKPKRKLLVGAVEDEAKFANTDAGASADMARARDAGFRVIAVTEFWQAPLRELAPVERDALRKAARAALAHGITPVVDVAQFGAATPLTETEQKQFASFAASVPRLVPQIEHVVVGNEPNTNLFWRPQFHSDGSDAAAHAYERLLARSYDAIKAVAPHVEVIGGGLAAQGSDRPFGKRPTHSPVAFIRELGDAYRASGRSAPIMDAFSMHVYGESSRVPPTKAHPGSTTIGIADYYRLEALLRHALGRITPIVYGEYGVNTTIPAAERTTYTGEQVASKKPVDARTQARFYSKAIRLAACQPLVEMLLFFHVTDEPQLEHFQTGMYYADGRAKPGLAEVAHTADSAAAGTLPCSG